MNKLYIILVGFVSYVSCSSVETPTALEISQTPLMQAAAVADLQAIKTVIAEIKKRENEEYKDRFVFPRELFTAHYVNMQDSQGRTALFIAAQEGNADIIKELAKVKFIDIHLSDNDGITPLAVAVTNGHIDAINALLDACENDGSLKKSLERADSKLKFTPLARAVKSGNYEIIKLLLDRGANASGPVALKDSNVCLVGLTNDKEISDMLCRKSKEYERGLELINALKHCKFKEAVSLLSAGDIDVNAKDEYCGQSPLHIAYEFADICQLLINSKANVNAKDQRGDTPMHRACRHERNKKGVQLLIDNKAYIDTSSLISAIYSSKDIAKLLINNKAEVNVKDGNDSPLHWAVRYKRKELINFLIISNANVNAKDDFWGQTPLNWAVDAGDTEIVQMLIEHKAEVNSKDKYYKQMPLHQATKLQNKDIVKLLIESKSNVNDKDVLNCTALNLAEHFNLLDIVEILKIAGVL